MKKIIAAVLLAAVCLCCFTACGDDSPESAFERGVWNGDEYSNAYLGLRFTMPEGYVAATDEEMAALMDMNEDVITNYSEFQLKIASLKTIYDAMVSNPTTGSGAMIMLENLKLTVGASKLTAQEYADILAEQLAQASVQGYTYDISGGREETLAGEDYYVLPCSLADGVMVQEYYLRRVDGYMLVLCFTGLSDEDMTAMKGAFAAPEA